MYKWLKAYLAVFSKDFPFSEVADLTEYEICRIIQYCVEHNTEYMQEIVVAVVGQGKVGEVKTGTESEG